MTKGEMEKGGMNAHALTRQELRATGALSAIFSSRLLGLFMIYPVFLAYASGLRGATPALIGLALGGYGLTQGLLQIPFGLMSDRIGRKTMIAIGLTIFAIGSVVAAVSTSILGVLLGRLLQGGGAVGSVVLAAVADVTREESRTRAMAVVGMTIGLSFIAAIILGPFVAIPFGVPGIFWLTAVLALVGIGIAYAVVPDASTAPKNAVTKARFMQVIRDPELLKLDFGIGALNAALTACFLAVPTLFAHTFGFASNGDWKLYLPVLLVSLALMVPAIVVAEKHHRVQATLRLGVATLALSLLALTFFGSSAIIITVSLVLFFTAFNVLEALLPSQVTRAAPAEAKGVATGAYSSAQFLGIFVGGAVGGIVLGAGGTAAVLGFASAIVLLWLLVAVVF